MNNISNFYFYLFCFNFRIDFKDQIDYGIESFNVVSFLQIKELTHIQLLKAYT
jgi:hypothetical protein